jgi:hypothetical protein
MRKSVASSRRPAPVVGASRPPVLLQFSAHHTVTAGHVGSLGPKHTAELPIPQLPATSSAAAEEYFQLYAAPIERLVHLLGGASQRVVVLHCQGLYANRHWKLGVLRILQDLLNVAAVSFQSALHMVPFALTTPSVPAVLLSVYVSATDAQCIIYANGNTLEYTYQSCGYKRDRETTAPTTVGGLRALQEGWLSENSPLVRAICCSLQQCPVQLRKPAIHNLLFAGTVLVDNFGVTVAKKLYDFLTGDPTREVLGPEEETEEKPSSILLTEVPVNRKLLLPLADHVAVIDTGIRSELLPWLGSSIWANYWHQYEEESGATASQLQWTGLPGTAIET